MMRLMCSMNGAPWKLGDFEKLQREREKQKREAIPLKVEDVRTQAK